ncbi:16S rRNA (guanine(966)-N(2))-methyltransferase RsmD [Candidatus Pantoea edessiphila]|uniref:Ribosomal RNA small subunit methyltransferase D n=1 Tax=Candidatus Pantoea edessiphila TaxID=2044610 RepID=A0A2P5SZT2_9GAMM|nr:16S rRNA (guanine(966)-N(2))-methyltransferase RsmD [Candidatus Pantoea edessiphila]PPI87841.1 16S rRNA (guanine(966)-N(2))-methyltransferase RsmD [Candidatus Pantoea edessiphila]
MKKFYNNYRSGYIRIIGGQWKRHRLPVLNKNELRPTTDRIRETLFNWLTPVIEKSNCLDCFAGSGSLGFEAISRYANYVIMLELNFSIVKQLQNNLNRFKVINSEIIQTDTLLWLKRKGTPFDIVFIDPPFKNNLINKTVYLLNRNGWLSSSSLIYIENKINAITINIPKNWSLCHKKTAGKVMYSLYQIK